MFGTGSRTYDVRVDYEDETTEVVSIPAASIAEAVEIARRDPEVVGTFVIGSFDNEPQAVLGW